jgi:ubiquitin-like 1-activating enzyme E1 B
MHKLWEKRKPPIPLDFEQIKNKDHEQNIIIQDFTNAKKLKSQSVWSIQECLEYFSESINCLKRKIENLGDEENKTLIWDKVSKSLY